MKKTKKSKALAVRNVALKVSKRKITGFSDSEILYINMAFCLLDAALKQDDMKLKLLTMTAKIAPSNVVKEVDELHKELHEISDEIEKKAHG